MRTVLAASGALLALIGGAMLTKTEAFLQTSGIEIHADPGLLSELRAPSGLLIISGAIMLAGSVRTRFVNLGLTTGSLVYGSYGVARLVSMILDGLPSGSLIGATAVELVLAGVLFILRRKNTLPSVAHPAHAGSHGHDQ